MMKIVLVSTLLLHFSLFSATSSSACMKMIKVNSGHLTFPEDSLCPRYTWLFDVSDRSTLVIDLSTMTNGDPILVKLKSSLSGPFVVSDRINNELSRRLRISSPTRQVALTVPSSRILFEARFRMLRRAPGLSASAEECRVRDQSVVINCRNDDCTFTCRFPDFIPRHKSATSVECRSEDWRHQVGHLCMPRESLRDLCFSEEGDTIKCEFDADDFIKFFKLEELEAEHGVPPSGGPRILGVHGNSKAAGYRHRRARFRDYVCKRREDTGKYKFKCATLKRRVMAKCIYWRYMTAYCKTGEIFT